MQKEPPSGASGLEGLGGTPQRGLSPAPAAGRTAPAQAAGAQGDLADLFGDGGGAPAGNSGAVGGVGLARTRPGPMAPATSQPTSNPMDDDLMNGFASLDMGGGKQTGQPPPPVGQQLQQTRPQQQGGGGGKSKDDLLDLF